MESRHIALTVLFLIVAVSFLVILSLFVAIKRHFYRRRLRLKSPYTQLGMGASKCVKKDIDDNLLATQKLRCEPRLLQQYYRDNMEVLSRSNETTFIFRMRAVDDFRQLEDTLGSVDPRSRVRAENCSSGWDRLRVYRGKHRALANAAANVVDEYVKLYTLARHEPGSFGRTEYNRFATLQRELVQNASNYSRRSNNRSRPTSQPLSPTELLVDLGGDAIEMVPLGAAGGRRPSADSSCSSSDDSQTALIECDSAFGGPAVAAVGTPTLGGGSGTGGSPAARYTPIRRRDNQGRSNEGAQC